MSLQHGTSLQTSTESQNYCIRSSHWQVPKRTMLTCKPAWVPIPPKLVWPWNMWSLLSFSLDYEDSIRTPLHLQGECRGVSSDCLNLVSGKCENQNQKYWLTTQCVFSGYDYHVGSKGNLDIQSNLPWLVPLPSFWATSFLSLRSQSNTSFQSHQKL